MIVQFIFGTGTGSSITFPPKDAKTWANVTPSAAKTYLYLCITRLTKTAVTARKLISHEPGKSDLTKRIPVQSQHARRSCSCCINHWRGQEPHAGRKENPCGNHWVRKCFHPIPSSPVKIAVCTTLKRMRYHPRTR